MSLNWVKNNTVSNKIWVGQTVVPNEYYNIQDEEQHAWAADEDLDIAIDALEAIISTNPDVQTLTLDAALVTSNEIDVDVDGVNINAVFATDSNTTLAAFAALIQAEAGVLTAVVTDVGAGSDDDRQIVVTTNTSGTPNLLQNFAVTLGASQANTTVVGGGDLAASPGKDALNTFGTVVAADPFSSDAIKFTKSGKWKNDSYMFLHENVSSNEAPWIVPFDGVLKSISFSNDEDSADHNIEIHKNGSQVLIYALPGTRKSIKTDGLSGVTVVAGDEISIFGEGTPTIEPINPMVVLSWKYSSGAGQTINKAT